MSFQFAWAGPGETAFGLEHEREDEEVFAFSLEHTEGDFATLSIDIRNPRRQFLVEGGNLWMWLSEDGEPLFFGRLVAVPEDLHAEIVRLNFIARPLNYETTKRALAETLRVAPWWDPVWIVDERLDDPDSAIEARSQLWHVDRVTHAVTVSDINVGEDATLEITDHDYASLSVSFGSPPVRRVRVEAEVSWDQIAEGTLDITEQLLAAFAAAGSPAGVASSYTGQGLEADWPQQGDDLKGGWRAGAVTLARADGVWKTPRYKDARVGTRGVRTSAGTRMAEQFVAAPATARFFAWEFRPSFPIDYSASRQRIERVSFELVGDVQRVFTDAAAEDEEILIMLASRKVSDPIDGVPPLGDLRRASYIKTDRGRRSLDYLVALARARLLARARAVEVSATLPFAAGIWLSCRMNATVTDDRLPGGAATGKVIGYVLRASGDGARRCEVTIGCTIGNGTTRTADPGTSTYAEDGYMNPGYQLRAGETFEAIAGEVTYADLSGAPIADDGVNLIALRPEDAILSLSVLNGEADQAAVLDARFEDIPAAVEAVNAAFTEVLLELRPLVGGPFETELDIAVSPLAVRRTLTL
jgi:hypothetical protein